MLVELSVNAIFICISKCQNLVKHRVFTFLTVAMANIFSLPIYKVQHDVDKSQTKVQKRSVKQILLAESNYTH